MSEDRVITARYPAHFGARVNGFELVDTLGDPERPVTRERIVEKMYTLAKWGELDKAQVKRAVDLVLTSDDAAAIDQMLAGWLS